MMTAALLAGLLLVGAGQETGSPGQSAPRDPAKIPLDKPKDEKPIGTKTYTDKALRLAFDYPANWTFQKADKNRPARFTIPIEGTTARGELQVIDLEYKAPPETFQETQAAMVTRMDQQLLRQWQIEVLGVPLLMTKLKSVGEDGERTTLVGLLYSNTPRKFNFRLSAPSANFEAVEYPWQSVLETLRTTTGALPGVEGTEPSKTPAAPPKEVRTEIGPRLVNVTFRGPVVSALAFGGTTGQLVLPKGWTTEPAGEGGLNLRHPRVSSPLLIKGFLAQADNPTSVLARAAVDSMATFATISRRYDKSFPTTRTGASASLVFRIGTATEGAARTAYDAVVAQDSLFVLLKGASASSEGSKAEMALLEELLTSIRLEPATAAGG